VQLLFRFHLTECVKNPINAKVSSCRCAKFTCMDSNIILVNHDHIVLVKDFIEQLGVDVVILEGLTFLSLIENVSHLVKESIIKLETGCIFVAAHCERNIHIVEQKCQGKNELVSKGFIGRHKNNFVTLFDEIF